MKPRSVLMALYVSFFTFSVLTLFFGETGVAALEKLNDRQRALNANLADLESRRESLKAQLSSLMSDPEAIVVEARSLGLYRPGDVVVRFAGQDIRRPELDAGQVLRLSPVRRTEGGFLRVFSVAAGLIVALGYMMAWRLNNANRPRR